MNTATANATRVAGRLFRNTLCTLIGVIGCAVGMYFILEIVAWGQNMSGEELLVMGGAGIGAAFLGLYCIAAVWSDLVEPWH